MTESSGETSPVTSVIEELEVLSTDFRSALEIYASRIEAEILSVRTAVERAEGKSGKLSSAKLRDLRDMLTLLRKFRIKPDKGRRKDLKKIDALIGDLALLTESW